MATPVERVHSNVSCLQLAVEMFRSSSLLRLAKFSEHDGAAYDLVKRYLFYRICNQLLAFVGDLVQFYAFIGQIDASHAALVGDFVFWLITSTGASESFEGDTLELMVPECNWWSWERFLERNHYIQLNDVESETWPPSVLEAVSVYLTPGDKMIRFYRTKNCSIVPALVQANYTNQIMAVTSCNVYVFYPCMVDRKVNAKAPGYLERFIGKDHEEERINSVDDFGVHCGNINHHCCPAIWRMVPDEGVAILCWRDNGMTRKKDEDAVDLAMSPFSGYKWTLGRRCKDVRCVNLWLSPRHAPPLGLRD